MQRRAYGCSRIWQSGGPSSTAAGPDSGAGHGSLCGSGSVTMSWSLSGAGIGLTIGAIICGFLAIINQKNRRLNNRIAARGVRAAVEVLLAVAAHVAAGHRFYQKNTVVPVGSFIVRMPPAPLLSRLQS